MTDREKATPVARYDHLSRGVYDGSDCGGYESYMEQFDDGEYVHYDDYARLEDREKALREALRRYTLVVTCTAKLGDTRSCLVCGGECHVNDGEKHAPGCLAAPVDQVEK